MAEAPPAGLQYLPRSIRKSIVPRLLLVLVLSFISPLVLSAPVTARSAPLPVVASFSIAGDWVRAVGGARVAVQVLIGPNQDSHGWQPSPGMARQFAGASLVVVNGLGLDDRVQKLARASGFAGEIVVASAGIAPLPAAAEEAGHEHGAHAADPHVWQDLALAATCVENIAGALIRADPAGAPYYRQRTQAYRAELARLGVWAQQQFAVLRPQQRRAIVSHDAFAYLARRFGVQLIPVQGKSGEGQASARLVAGLIRQIRETRLKAVFVENINNGRLTRQIARETGVQLGGELYSDSLSRADGPAADYLSFYRHNVQVMVDGMRRN